MATRTFGTVEKGKRQRRCTEGVALDQTEMPVWRQYLQIRQRYPDTLLLFRIGDDYEAFDQDAQVVSGVLDIAQSTRKMNDGKLIAVAGFPSCAGQASIQRLVAAGHRVAVCEKVGKAA